MGFREDTFEWVEEQIDKHGFATIGTWGNPHNNEVPFSYTIGLVQSFQHPEILIAGLDANIAHGLMHEIVSRIREGESFVEENKDFHEIVRNYPVRARHLSVEAKEQLYVGNAYYQDQAWGAVQIIWPDINGNMPTNPACDPQTRKTQEF